MRPNECVRLTRAEKDLLEGVGWVFSGGPYDTLDECQASCLVGTGTNTTFSFICGDITELPRQLLLTLFPIPPGAAGGTICNIQYEVSALMTWDDALERWVSECFLYGTKLVGEEDIPCWGKTELRVACSGEFLTFNDGLDDYTVESTTPLILTRQYRPDGFGDASLPLVADAECSDGTSCNPRIDLYITEVDNPPSPPPPPPPGTSPPP